MATALVHRHNLSKDIILISGYSPAVFDERVRLLLFYSFQFMSDEGKRKAGTTSPNIYLKGY